MMTVDARAGRLPVWLLAAAIVWVVIGVVVVPLFAPPAVAGTANVRSASVAGMMHPATFRGREVVLGSGERATIRLPVGDSAAMTIRPARSLLRWRPVIAQADGVTRGGSRVARGQPLAPGVEYSLGSSAVTFVGLRLVPSRARQILLATVFTLPGVLAVAGMTFGPYMIVPRLAGAVVPANSAAIPLHGVSMVIGSAPGADIRMPGAPLVATLGARRAGWQSSAEIAPAPGTIVLVNGCRVLTSHPLHDGAEIRIGNQQFLYRSTL